MPIEKGIMYIKLAKFPLLIEGNAKHSPDDDGIYHETFTDDDGIYHETESLVNVNA